MSPLDRDLGVSGPREQRVDIVGIGKGERAGFVSTLLLTRTGLAALVAASEHEGAQSLPLWRDTER
jgi:hypothetical protein